MQDGLAVVDDWLLGPLGVEFPELGCRGLRLGKVRLPLDIVPLPSVHLCDAFDGDGSLGGGSSHGGDPLGVEVEARVVARAWQSASRVVRTSRRRSSAHGDAFELAK